MRRWMGKQMGLGGHMEAAPCQILTGFWKTCRRKRGYSERVGV